MSYVTLTALDEEWTASGEREGDEVYLTEIDPSLELLLFDSWREEIPLECVISPLPEDGSHERVLLHPRGRAAPGSLLVCRIDEVE